VLGAPDRRGDDAELARQHVAVRLRRRQQLAGDAAGDRERVFDVVGERARRLQQRRAVLGDEPAAVLVLQGGAAAGRARTPRAGRGRWSRRPRAGAGEIVARVTKLSASTTPPRRPGSSIGNTASVSDSSTPTQ